MAFSSLVYADTKHTVEKGETLYSIGRKYQITVPELRAANNLSENDVLKAGQKLVIPTADIESAVVLSSTPVSTKDENLKTKIYTVQKGDTYYGIARKYSVKVSELFALNGLGNNDVLKVGQKLKVPDAETSKVADSGTESKTNLSASAKGIVWPVNIKTVEYVKGKVSGVQLVTKSSEEVKNIRSGTVMYCGVYRGYGEVVFVQSKTGLIYAYTGLGSTKVKKGDYIVYGDSLGTTSASDAKGESKLMLMVFQNGNPIDPAKAPRG